MAPPQSVAGRAHGKINLALSVGPPEAGGMHPIVSWMSAIDLADDVAVDRLTDDAESTYTIEPAEDAATGAAVRVDWPVESDLAVRAHRLVEREAGRRLPVRMRLVKRIPAGGGLGGGSSDAATMLRAVNHLFGLDLPSAQLRRLGAELGSDVAFFLDGGVDAIGSPPRPAIVTGLGEEIERVGSVDARLLLIMPPFGCPTGAVYRAYDGLGPSPLRGGEVRELAEAAARWGRIDSPSLFNDLAAAAEAEVPRLAEVRRACEAALGMPVHVTGSGSTLFCVLEGESPSAEELAQRLREGLAVERGEVGVIPALLC